MTELKTRPADTSITPSETTFRALRASVDETSIRVARGDGKFGAGIMYGVSLIARGEALGHGMFVDEITLDQVADLSGKLGKKGLKSRFTHPSMSSDGTGKHLGRIVGTERFGDRVLGDLHLSKSAEKTPDGNLADYVMTLAEEDAEAAGLSIVFERDIDEEMQFMLSHGATISESGRINFDDFVSPDEMNTGNLPHVRVATLRAADVVDEPAANPDGMFDRQPTARKADQFLSFALGVSSDKPDALFGVDPERAKQFLARWFDSNGFTLTKKEETMPTETPEAPTQPTETRSDFAAELGKYTDRFGAENGAKWFQEGKEFAECLELQIESLSADNESLREKIAELEAVIETAQLGEADPIDTAGEATTPKVTFGEYVGGKRNATDRPASALDN